MKFTAVSWYEKYHKRIMYALIFVVTIILVCLYFFIKDNMSNIFTYIAGIFYALFLFIVTVYLDSQSTKIDSLFYKRKKQYLNFKELKGLYNLRNLNDLYSFIIANQTLTRLHKQDTNEKSFIKEDGWYFKSSYLELESLYISQAQKIREIINQVFKKYSKYKTLPLDLEDFLINTEDWCNKQLNDNDLEKSSIKTSINTAKLENKKEIEKFFKIKRRLKKKNDKIYKKIINLLEYFEKIYGEQLDESIANDDFKIRILQEIQNSFRELQNSLLTYDDVLSISERNEVQDEQRDNIIIGRLNEIDNAIDLLLNKIFYDDL